MSENNDIATKIVDKIVNDLGDRRGLSNEWDCIDKDVRKEIIQTWTKIVEDNLNQPQTSQREYDTDITKQSYGDLYTVDEWKISVENGWIMDDDGSGYWVKDGLECRDCDVFYSEPKDATHVMWYNK